MLGLSSNDADAKRCTFSFSFFFRLLSALVKWDAGSVAKWLVELQNKTALWSARPRVGTGTSRNMMASSRKEKKRKDYAFQRQFNEKPIIILGCPGWPQAQSHVYVDVSCCVWGAGSAGGKVACGAAVPQQELHPPDNTAPA